MFSVESSSPLSLADLAYLESMFAKQGLTWEEIDEAFFSDEHQNALESGYTFLFFVPEPNTTIPICQRLSVDRCYFHPFLALRHPLEARQLSTLRLVPFDARSVAYVLLPYYRQRYPHLGETWALLKSGTRAMSGVVVHPSIRVHDQWQLTYFDRDGLSYHETRPKGSDTLLDLFARRYVIPAPEVVDELALHSWLEQG